MGKARPEPFAREILDFLSLFPDVAIFVTLTLKT